MFLGKRDKLVLSPLTRLKVRWNFVTIYSRLRDSLAKPLKKREKGRKLGIVRQTRMAGICLAKPAIKQKIRYREAKQNVFYLLLQTSHNIETPNVMINC